MEIYLAQHGEAKSEEEDSHRPLTENGQLEVAAVALALKRHALRAGAIWHSGKLRRNRPQPRSPRPWTPPTGSRKSRG